MTSEQRNLANTLVRAIEASGFAVSGPTDIRAAEDGEPAWVCEARLALAEYFCGDSTREYDGCSQPEAPASAIRDERTIRSADEMPKIPRSAYNEITR